MQDIRSAAYYYFAFTPHAEVTTAQHQRDHVLLRCLPALLLLLAAIVAISPRANAQTLPRIDIAANAPERIFTGTNSAHAFYACVANGENSSGFHGITRAKTKLFENHWLLLGDKLLNKNSARVTIEPGLLTRHYSESNTVERVQFSDPNCALLVSITTDYRGPVTIVPGLATALGRETHAASASRFSIDGDNPCIMQVFQPKPGLRGAWDAATPELISRLKNPGPVHVPAVFRAESFAAGSPLCLAVEFPSDKSAARTPRQFSLPAATVLHGAQIVLERRDTTYSRAELWIQTAMKSLVMQGKAPAIWAGLPWFDEEWGRDTFISLPGALLAQGEYEAARALLLSFIGHQNTREDDANFGRIPNRIQPGSIIYNTADGTPWFVRQAWRYLECSGDTAFARELYPALERAIRGARRHHTDSLGFLTHADADTWMDAVGPKGPWSPRGNRAVEIQALWIDQLETSARIARMCGRNAEANEWRTLRDTVKGNFLRHFISERNGALVDHLNADGSRDEQSRPNVLIALTAPRWPFIPEEIAQATLQAVIRDCVYPYGVASLSQHDARFHPYHNFPQRYPKDAAYHNGTIWTWLSGPAISALCAAGLPDSAWRLTEALERLAFTQGAAGTLPECTDAIARAGDTAPRWSGTFSQAWSTAEYIRTLHEDYLGIHCHALGDEQGLRLQPRLPADILYARALARVGKQSIGVEYERVSRDSLHMTLTHFGNAPVRVRYYSPWEKRTSVSDRLLEPGMTISFGSGKNEAPDNLAVIPRALRFCAPKLDSGLASIRPPAHQFIEPAEALAKNPAARVFFTAADPAGDDAGQSGNYSYPKHPFFKKGIFDLREFSVHADETRVYFRIRMSALSQPGWHPEYGFQLTMLAIGIDQSGDPSRQERAFRNNSRYTLPRGAGYDKLVLVGGGVQVRSKDDAILGAFTPTEPAHAFGNAATGIIEFAIPIAILGRPHEEWQYHIVAGAQDDHGGAGIGEFRDVLAAETEWNGGGNLGNGANIYDELHSALPARKKPVPATRY